MNYPLLSLFYYDGRSHRVETAGTISAIDIIVTLLNKKKKCYIKLMPIKFKIFNELQLINN